MQDGFPRRLKKARAERGWRQGDLAQATSVSRTEISAYENGMRNPSARSLAALSEALGVSSAWLSGEEGALEPDDMEEASPGTLRHVSLGYGRRLAEARAFRGLSQVDLARWANVRASLVIECEKGVRLPDPDASAAFCRVLGLRSAWLENGEAPMLADPEAERRRVEADTDPRHVAARIREARMSREWSQAKLAGQIHVADAMLADFETGARVPDIVSLELMADALGVRVPWLAEGRGHMLDDGAPETTRLVPTLEDDGCGRRIREARTLRNLTMKELGAAVSLSTSSLGAYELAERQPSHETLQKIAQATDVRLPWLESGEGAMLEDPRAEKERLLAEPPADGYGERIREARAALGWSQTALASAIQLSSSTIAAYELAQRRPRHEVFQRIADAMGVSLAWLESGKGPMLASGDAGREPRKPELADTGYGERIKQVRQALGWSQLDLTRAASLSHSSLAAYETCDRRPGHDVFQRLADATGVSLAWLEHGEGSMHPDGEPEPIAPPPQDPYTARLKHARALAGWTQETLAQASAVTVSQISAYEKGERRPGKESNQKIADAMGVSARWLETGEEPVLLDPEAERRRAELAAIQRPERQEYAARLRQARETVGWTQARLAEGVPSVTARQLAAFELGRRLPSLSTSRELAEAMGVGAKWLEAADGPMLLDPEAEKERLARAAVMRPSPQEYGKRLREAREIVGWTQAQLAEKSSTSPSRISSYETMDKLPTMSTSEKLAQALGVSLHWMESGEGPILADAEAEQRRLAAGPKPAPVDRHALGVRLKQARARCGYTQARVSRESGIREKKVSSYENGDSLPRRPVVEALCRVLGVRVPWAEYGEEPMLAETEAAEEEAMPAPDAAVPKAAEGMSMSTELEADVPTALEEKPALAKPEAGVPEAEVLDEEAFPMIQNRPREPKPGEPLSTEDLSWLPKMVDFGDRVRRAREARGLSIAALSARAGVDQIRLAGLEDELLDTDLATFQALCQALRVSPQWLATGEGPDPWTRSRRVRRGERD